MKNTYTLLCLLLTHLIYAQNCTIDQNQNQVGLYPALLPSAVANAAYNQDITFVLPTDTLGYDFTNFQILSLALPAGLSWTCSNNTNNCNYNPQIAQHGCVNIHGVPLLAGSYTIAVNILADLTILSGYPIVFELELQILPSQTASSNNGFTIANANSCSPALITFSNNNLGLLQYQWDFGNGNLSFEQNPGPQYYANPGTYIVHYTAFASLDTTEVYTLEQLGITSMSNYGGGFPSFDNADAYFKLKENGLLVYQAPIIGNQNPPVQWNLNYSLNPNSSYVIEIWEADESCGELYFGADDFMGSHSLSLNGCGSCAAGTSVIHYQVSNQQILPAPAIFSSDTLFIDAAPPTPLIYFDSLNHMLSTPDLGFYYQWYFNGVLLTGATLAAYTIEQSGPYTLAAINANGCTAVSDTLLAVYCNPAIGPTIHYANGILSADNIAIGAQITWFFNDQIISNANTTSVTASENGNYSCVINDSYGCIYQSNFILIDMGIVAKAAAHPIVYPNPNNGIFAVQSPLPWQNCAYQLYSLQGQLLLKGQLMQHTALDIQTQPKGTYLLIIEKESVTFRCLIVKDA